MQTFPYSVIGPHGRVIASGTTTDVRLVPLATGETIIYQRAPTDHWWDARAEAFVPMGAQPSLHHQFDWPTHQWVDERTLEVRRQQKWTEIKAARDLAEVSGFPYMGKVIQSDAKSVQRITVAASVSEGKDWTCADNTVLQLDVEGVKGMPAALARHIDQLHQTAKELRARINAAGSPAEIDAIAWPG
jgi:hypothetical protein